MSLAETASGLLTTIMDKAEDIVPEAAGKGFDSLLDQGEDLLGKLDDEGLKSEGRKALDILSEGKKPFQRLSVEAFGKMLGHFGNDEEEKAKNIYIATQATYAERRAWMQAGGDLAQKDREERDAAWEEIKVVLKKVGVAGFKFLAKLVLGSLGLPPLLG